MQARIRHQPWAYLEWNSWNEPATHDEHGDHRNGTRDCHIQRLATPAVGWMSQSGPNGTERKYGMARRGTGEEGED